MKSLFVLCFLAILSIALGHMCLYNPTQRGSLYAPTAGSNDCALVDGPCGKRDAAPPKVLAQAGSNFTFVFQKNLDHFYSSNPGNFTISWAPTLDGAFKTIGTISDDKQPSLTFYTFTFTLPTTVSRHGVMQVVYYTNNPNAPSAFYQCADFAIVH